MTSTTTRRATEQQVWPSRREREGGRRVRRDAASMAFDAAVVRVDGPGPVAPRSAQHAAPGLAVSDRTERLPVIPQQRATAPVTSGPRPGPGRVVTVPPGPASRPLPAAPTPCPPRPSVGSGVPRGITDTGPGHRVDGRTRLPRNGMGLAALCLGLVALPLGLLPVTAVLAAGLGVLALVYGVAGWSRARSGAATNRGSAVTGAVLGLVTLVIGVVGTIAFFHNPAQPVYDLNALRTSVVSSPIGE